MCGVGSGWRGVERGMKSARAGRGGFERQMGGGSGGGGSGGGGSGGCGGGRDRALRVAR